MDTTTWSVTLLVINCTMLLIEQSSGWLWPVRLFSRQEPDTTGEGPPVPWAYRDPAVHQPH